MIDTGTRSRPPAEAAAVVARVAAQVKDAGPDWIYKKVDSLLRGPVVAEIEAVLAATGLPRCLLVPANPSRGRLVQNGELWLGGRRLHETDFAHDPGPAPDVACTGSAAAWVVGADYGAGRREPGGSAPSR